jgi:hypothetical protein
MPNLTQIEQELQLAEIIIIFTEPIFTKSPYNIFIYLNTSFFLKIGRRI